MPQLTIKVHGADIVRKGLEDLSNEIPKISRLRIYEMMRRAKARLSADAPRPSYPIDWDSEKQRRAYFATDGFGGGIPYRRTGAMPAGWEIVRVDPNGYRMENNQDNAVYVYGDYSGARQSKIHRGRHPIFQEVLENEIQGLPEEIEQFIGYYARQKGF